MGDSDALEPFPVEQQLRRDGRSVDTVRLWVLLNVPQPCRATSFDAYDGICCEHPPGVVLRTSSEGAHGMLASPRSDERGRSSPANERSRYACGSQERRLKRLTRMTMYRFHIVGSQRDIHPHGSRSAV